MEKGELYAGAALRRMRKNVGLTQNRMAARLGISPSYLHLLERNQRPVSTRVLMQLVSEFEVDPLTLRPDSGIGGAEALARRLSDARFADLAIDRHEVEELLATAPHIAAAFARLYDGVSPAADMLDDPVIAAREAVEQWRNHFADLDHAAEQRADELRLSRGDTATALTEHLRQRHQLSVRILPEDVLPGLTRRLDLHARQVQLNETLSPAQRTFEVARQIALLEQRGAVEAIAAGSGLTPASAARVLFERHLYSYFAAALVMPYGRFVRACHATEYDLPILQRRFGVTFDLLAFRLTTLQRIGERGLPMFMVRVDAAGQVARNVTGASGANFLENAASCPKWNLHHAIARPGEWQIQRIEIDSASPPDWITIARSTGDKHFGGLFATAIGVEARFEGELAMVRRAADIASAQTGLGCIRCHRTMCQQRSRPRIGADLNLGRAAEPSAPFGTAPHI